MYILQCLDRIDANVLASHLDDHIDRYVATNIALQGSTVTRHAAVSIRDAIAADHANVGQPSPPTFTELLRPTHRPALPFSVMSLVRKLRCRLKMILRDGGVVCCIYFDSLPPFSPLCILPPSVPPLPPAAATPPLFSFSLLSIHPS